MWDVTHNKSFGLVLTVFNEVRKRIDYILGDIYIFFYRSDLRIEALIGYTNVTG